MYTGQVVYKPSLYSEDRFKKQDKLLYEVIIDNNNKLTYLYYIDAKIKINEYKKIELIDEKAGVSFLEDDNTTINVYDAYSIEFISTDYDLHKYDREVISVSRYIIHANRTYKPVIKTQKRAKYKDKLNYDYYVIYEKGKDNGKRMV